MKCVNARYLQAMSSSSIHLFLNNLGKLFVSLLKNADIKGARLKGTCPTRASSFRTATAFLSLSLLGSLFRISFSFSTSVHMSMYGWYPLMYKSICKSCRTPADEVSPLVAISTRTLDHECDYMQVQVRACSTKATCVPLQPVTTCSTADFPTMCAAKEPQKRNCLSLEKKVEVIRYQQKNPTISIRALGEQFNCGKTQIAHVLKNKADILSLFHQNVSGSRHITGKSRASEFADVNEALYKWFCIACSKKHLSWRPRINGESQRDCRQTW